MLNEFILNNFKKRYVINLKNRNDRYEEFKNRTEKYFDYNIIEKMDGIFGLEVDRNKLEYPILANFSKPGELGIFLTNLEIWKNILEDDDIKDDDLILVFEDDVFFNDHFGSDFINAIEDFKKIEDKSKILYLGGRFDPNFNPPLIDNIWKPIPNNSLKERLGITDIKMGKYYDRTIHIMIYTKSAIKITYNLLNILDISYPIDVYYIWCTQKNSELKSYDYFPHLCYSPSNYKTDIQLNSRSRGIFSKRLFRRR